MISEHPAMIIHAKKEVLLILAAPKMGRRILRLDAMRSQAKRTMVSQTA
jgi:hypothetical protein